MMYGLIGRVLVRVSRIFLMVEMKLNSVVSSGMVIGLVVMCIVVVVGVMSSVIISSVLMMCMFIVMIRFSSIMNSRFIVCVGMFWVVVDLGLSELKCSGFYIMSSLSSMIMLMLMS